MDLKHIRQIIELMKENDLAEFELQEDGFRIAVKRGGQAAPQVVTTQAPSLPAAAAAAAVPPLPGAGGEPEQHEGFNPISSPMVGTFYRAATPDADAFISVGDEVDEDTVVCIVEAMKVMNEIKAEVSGEIVDILVENGEAVEFGQPLFLISER